MKVIKNTQEVIRLLNDNHILILPTDTIYGIHCKALNIETVERVYDIKGRDKDKPFIIQVSKIEELELFGIKPTPSELEVTQKYWPGPVSIIFERKDSPHHYLHRGGFSLAFRVSNFGWLKEVIRETGPLISTSANISGQENIKSVEGAKEIFNYHIQYVFNGGVLDNPPSAIVKIVDGKEVRIR